jgi:3-oxoacyl-[acyl-carrier-protein] synthase-3
MNCKIAHIEYHLPEKILTNQDLLKENPSWDIDGLLPKTGIHKRHIAADGETAFDLGVKACRKIFDQKLVSTSDIDAVIFCTQSPDYIFPGNAFLLHNQLNLSEHALAFDINLACSGYVYGLSIAKAFLNTYPIKNLLFVTADTYSKYIHPKDKSVRLLFGDGAAATILKPSTSGIIDIKLGTFGKGYEHFMIPAGGCRTPKGPQTRELITDKSGNSRTMEHIAMEGFALVSLARGKVMTHIREVLAANRLTVKDIDLFIFHQASQLVLDSVQKALEVPNEKIFNNLVNIGNTVSSSLPIALKDAWVEKRIKSGDKILLCGFGVGFSWGTALLEWS